jgi:hypothetical protein
MSPSKTKAVRYEHPLQLGGIRTATMDYPEAGGGPGCRVALIDTGSGLRFTVALDKGGDIVDAAHNDTNLACLTPNGLRPPSHAPDRDDDWLRNWAGGLLTTCGPETIGAARVEDGRTVPQHGRHFNTPAALVGIENPDPHRGTDTMSITLLIRETKMFGPVFEVRRTISCRLGVPEIELRDEVTNIGDAPASHNWLYHVNLGYPLVDHGARLVYRGQAAALPFTGRPMSATRLNRFKRIPGPKAAHAGAGEDCVFIDPPPDRKGLVHVGLVNSGRKIGLELTYRKKQLPRLVNWQHFGPSGSYVTGIEPFYGSLLGKDNDGSPLARTRLNPGQRRRYDLTLRVLTMRRQIDALRKHDGPLTPVAAL